MVDLGKRAGRGVKHKPGDEKRGIGEKKKILAPFNKANTISKKSKLVGDYRQMRLTELKARAISCEAEKLKLIKTINDYNLKLKKGTISFVAYKTSINMLLKGKPTSYWLNYYDSQKRDTVDLIREMQNPVREINLKQPSTHSFSRYAAPKRNNRNSFFMIAAILILSLPVLFLLGNFLGFTTAPISVYQEGEAVNGTILFLVGDGWNESNAVIRASLNEQSSDILAKGLVSNGSIIVFLDEFEIMAEEGELYVDLIDNETVVESRKIVISIVDDFFLVENETLNASAEEVSENLTFSNETIVFEIYDNETVSVENETEFFDEHKHIAELNRIKKKTDKFEIVGIKKNNDKFDVDISLNPDKISVMGNSLKGSLKINGLKNVTDIVNVQSTSLDSILLNGKELLPRTQLVAVNHIDIDSATITLKKDGEVDTIARCAEWDFDNKICLSGWDDTSIAFLQNETDVTFTVTQFSSYIAVFQQEVTNCAAEDSAAQGSFATACDFPDGSALELDGGTVETHTYSKTLYGGVRIQSVNTSITDCSSIVKVELCYEWWVTSAPQYCDISVDANGGANYTAVTTLCPGTTPNPGVTCTDVTSLEAWTCPNFFGPTGTRAYAKSENNRGSAGKDTTETTTWDVFFFNITYNASVETVPPAVFNVRPIANTQYSPGSNIEISANVTDVSGVSKVLANVTYPNGTVTLLALTRVGLTQNYSTNYLVPQLLGRYNVTFIANDTNGNTNRSVTTYFIATDLNIPTSNSPPDQNVQIGQESAIKWQLYDSSPGYYYVERDGLLFKAASPWTNGTDIVIEPYNAFIGTHNYTIYYNDSSGNPGIPDTVFVTVSYTSSLNCNDTDQLSSPTKSPISIDGNLSDWDPILANPLSYVLDLTKPLGDTDPIQSAYRDLTAFAYTWDNDKLYFYFRRLARSPNVISMLVYMDYGVDGYMNSTDQVIEFRWSGTTKTYNSYLYNYNPVSTGDLMNGSGYILPGSVTINSSLKTNIPGGGPNGYRLEAAVNWTRLRPKAPSQILFQAASSRGTNIPSQVEDTTNRLDGIYAPLLFQPNNTKSAINGTALYYVHELLYCGLTRDSIEISNATTLGFPLVLYYSNGSIIPDLNSNGKPDVTLNPNNYTAIVARISVPSTTPDGTTDITSLTAISSFTSGTKQSVSDKTLVGRLAIIPSIKNRTSSQCATIYTNITVYNRQGFTDTIDLSSSSSMGWSTNITLLNGSEISDTNSNGKPDIGSLDPMESITAVVRTVVPCSAIDYTTDKTTITINSSIIPSTGYQSLFFTGVRPRITLEPSYNSSKGIGKTIYYPLTVTNNWNQTDTIDISYTSLYGWQISTLQDDILTPLQDTDSDTIPDTGLVEPYGGEYVLYFSVHVPDDSGINYSEFTIAYANSSINPLVYATARLNTSAGRILTYSDVARTTQAYSFQQNSTVYARASGLAGISSVYFEWIDPVKNVSNYSASIAVNPGDYADDELLTNFTTTPGTWVVLVFDAVKNTLISRNNFTISDLTPPTTTLTYPPHEYIKGGSPPINMTFNCSATDNNGLANISLYITNASDTEFSINSTINISGTSNSTSFFLSLESGFYTWNCRATDLSGNSAFASQNRTLTTSYIDTASPGVLSLSPQQGAYFNVSYSAEIAANVTDDSDVSSAWITLTYPNSTTINLSLSRVLLSSKFNTSLIIPKLFGRYNITIYANDTTGNLNSTENYFYAHDTISPAVLNPMPTQNTTYPSQAAVSIGANITDNYAVDSAVANIILPNGSLVPLPLTNSNLAWYNSTFYLPNIPGRYNITFTANDTFGNANNAVTTYFIMYDSVPPNSTSPQNQTVEIGALASIAWTLKDDYMGGSYYVEKDGQIFLGPISWNSGQSVQTYIPTYFLGIANYTIYYNDSNGNYGEPDTVFINVVDTLNPDCSELDLGYNIPSSYTITIDGEMDEWDPLLYNNHNYLPDLTGETGDLDPIQSAFRDLTHFAYTWDDTYIYFYFKRLANGPNTLSSLIYMDYGLDHYMNSTDQVLELRWSGTNRKVDSFLYNYNPVGNDFMNGSGYTLPGTVSINKSLESDLLGVSESGLQIEGRVAWSELRIQKPQLLFFQGSLSRGTNLPSQVEDNTGFSGIHYSALLFRPNNTGTATAGSDVYYTHDIQNCGIEGSKFDLMNKSSLGYTLTFYYPNSTLIPDTNANGYQDIDLGVDNFTTLIVKVSVPGSAVSGSVEYSYITAVSPITPNFNYTVMDRTSVGTVLISPSEISGTAEKGVELTYNLTLYNLQDFADVININYSSSLSWNISFYDENLTLLTDTNNDSLLDSGVIMSLEQKIIYVRINVPDNAVSGTTNKLKIFVNSSANPQYSDTSVITTIVQDKLVIEPNYNRSGGIGSNVYYLLTVTNNQNISDVIDLNYSYQRGWDTAFYEYDQTTPMNDTDSDGLVDTGLLDGLGAQYQLFLRIIIPETAVRGDSEYTVVYANSSFNALVSDISIINTTATSLTTFQDAARSVEKINFVQGNTVYARAFSITANNVYFIWIDSNGTFVRTSPVLPVTAELEVDDSFTTNLSSLLGEWTVVLFNDKGDVEIDRTYFYLVDTNPPTVSLNYPNKTYYEPTTDYINLTVNCSATDASGLVNMSLYLTDNNKNNFTFNQSVNITGTSNSSSFDISLESGSYTWNCRAFDIGGNSAFASQNGTIITEDNQAPQVLDLLPLKNSTQEILSTIIIRANITDDYQVDTAYALITYPNGTVVYRELINSYQNFYYANFTLPYLYGRFNISYFANDTVNNINNTVTSYFYGDDTIRPYINSSAAKNQTGGNEILQGQNITLIANVTEIYSGLNFTNVWLTYPDGINSSIFNMTCTGNEFYGCTFEWIKTSRIGNYYLYFLAEDYNELQSLSSDTGASGTLFKVVCNNQADNICTDYYSCPSDPDCLCTGLQLIEYADHYLVDNCNLRVRVAKSDVFINFTTYDMGDGGFGEKSSTAFIGDVYEYDTSFLGSDLLYLDRTGVTYTTANGTFTLSSDSGGNISLLKNDSQSVIIKVVYQDDNMRLEKQIIIANQTDTLAFKYYVKNVGTENLSDVVLKAYKDFDMESHNGQETRDEKSTFKMDTGKKIDRVVHEMRMNESEDPRYGEAFFTSQADQNGGKQGGVFTTGKFYYVDVAQVKPNDSELLPYDVNLTSETVAHSDLLEVYAYSCQELELLGGCLISEGMANSDDPQDIWNKAKEFVEKYSLLIGDSAVRNETRQSIVPKGFDFNLSIDVVNKRTSNATNLTLNAFIYDTNNILVYATNISGVDINSNLTFDDFVVGSIDTSILPLGPYQLEIQLVENGELLDIDGSEFYVVDGLPPDVLDPRPVENSTHLTNSVIEIGANVTDDIAVDKVYATILYPNGTNITIELDYDSGDWYSASFTVPELFGRYNVTYFANDTSGNLNNTVTTYFYPADSPPSVNDQRPIEGYTYASGQIVNIGANVTDDIAVDTVLAIINYPNGTNLTILLELLSGDWYNATFTVPILDGQYNISFFANDTSGQINDTVFSFFVTQDDEPPSVFDPQPDNETNYSVGYPLEIGANATDNVIIDTVIINITYPNGTSEILTLGNPKNDWHNISFVPSLLGQYNVSYIANDTSNNLNDSISTFFIVVDNVPPGVADMRPINGSSKIESSFIEIGANVTDNYQVDSAYATVNFPNGTSVTVQLSPVQGDWYNTSYQLPALIGKFNVTYYANDTFNLVNDSEFVEFFVIDDEPPQVFDLRPIFNATYNTSDIIEIGANVTDNIAVDEVRIIIRYPNASIETKQINLQNDDWYNITFAIPNLPGLYNVTFIANDTSNNINNTESTQFVVVDNVPPDVFDMNPANGSVEFVDTLIEVGANVTDNYMVDDAYATIKYPNGSTATYKLQNAAQDWYNISFYVPHQTGMYNVTYYANDTYNNINDSESTYFIVIDDVPPLIYDPRPVENSSFKTVEKIVLAANATDNIAVDTVYANITYPNGTIETVILTNIPGTITYASNYTIPRIPGQYNVTYFVNDTSNNKNQTTSYFVANNLNAYYVTRFNVSSFTVDVATYTQFISVKFNSSRPNTNYALFFTMDAFAESGSSGRDLYGKILIDGSDYAEELLRHVEGLYDEGSSGFAPFIFNVSAGEHNISVQFLRTGSQAVNVNDLNFVLLETGRGVDSHSFRYESVPVYYIHSNLSFAPTFSWAINKSAISPTFISGKFGVSSTSAATLSYYYFDPADNNTSPYWQRYLSGAADRGSLVGSYIEIEDSGLHNFSIYSRTDGGIVTVNGSIIDFDLADQYEHTVPNYQVSNNNTNISSSLSLGAGNNKILSHTSKLLYGDSYFVSFMASFSSSSGSQKPRVVMNSTDIPQENCYVKKERLLKTNSDLANVFFYTICRNLTVGQQYTLDVWMEVPAGETIVLRDESLSVFEVKLTDISTSNLPPNPGTITNPVPNDNKSKEINITWTPFPEPNGDPVIYNITLYNPDGSYNKTINTSTPGYGQPFNTSEYPDGNWTIVIEGCDPYKACSNTSVSFIIDNTAPSIMFVDPTDISGSTVPRDYIYLNVTAYDLYFTNMTIFLYNTTGLINVTVTNYDTKYLLYASLPNGLYYFNATAYDAAGNSNSTETRNVTLLKPLEYNITVPYPNQKFNDSDNVTFCVNVSNPALVNNIYVNVTIPRGSTAQFDLTYNGTPWLYCAEFNDTERIGIYNFTVFVNDTFGNLTNKTSFFDVTLFYILDVIDRYGKRVLFDVENVSEYGGLRDIKVTLHNHPITEIYIYAYNETYAFLNEIQVESDTDDNFFNSTFSIDMSLIKFVEANVTFTSTGKHMFKCYNFTFDGQECLDSDDYNQTHTHFIPGQNYTILINAIDPGFGITIEGQENITDSYLRSGISDENYGGATFIRVGRKNPADIFRGIIKFNLSHLSPGTTIVGANLSLFFIDMPSGENLGDRTQSVHLVQQSPAREWDELNATWNNYNFTSAWTSPGGDYNATPTKSQTFNSSRIGTWINFTVTTDVQYFIDNPDVNFGWIIKGLETSNNFRVDYASTENDNESIRPKLHVILPDNYPPVVFDLRPINGTNYSTAQYIEIGANVTDNVLVDTVLANISYPNGTNVLLTLNNPVGTWYNISFFVPELLGPYNVSFIANDTTNLLNDSEYTIFNAIDTEPPQVFDPRPISGTFYNSTQIIEIGANITDNIAISYAYANITLPNSSVITIPLTNYFGDWYNSSYQIPVLFGQYNITYYANDTSGLVNDTTTTYFTYTQDIEPPQVFDPRPLNSSNYTIPTVIEVGANITDNVAVSYAYANITFPNGSVVYLPLTNSFGDWYNTSYMIFGPDGRFNVTFYANDTSALVNDTTTTYFIYTQDINPPLVFDPRPLNGSNHSMGSFIEVGANITDDVAVSYAYANITYPNGTVINLPLTNSFGDWYNITFLVPNIYGRYNVTYYANDTAGLTNDTTTTYFTAYDNTPPDVYALIPNPGINYLIQDTIEIAATVTDNVMVDYAYINITYPNSTVVTLPLTNTTYTYYTTSFIIPNLTGTYTVNYYANDTFNLWNNTESTFFIAIQEQVETQCCCGMTASVTPKIVKQGENLLVTANAIDLYTLLPANESSIKSINTTIYHVQDGVQTTIVPTEEMIYLDDGLWYYEFYVGENISGNYVASVKMITNQVPEFTKKASDTFTVAERASGLAIMGVSPDFVNIDQLVMLAAEISYNAQPIESSLLANASLAITKINGSTQYYTINDFINVSEGLIYLQGAFNETGVYYLNWTVDYLGKQRQATEIVVVVRWEELIESINNTNSQIVKDIVEARNQLSSAIGSIEDLQDFSEEEVFLITDSVNSMNRIVDSVNNGSLSPADANAQFRNIKTQLENRLGGKLTGSVVGSQEKDVSFFVKLKDWRYLLFVVILIIFAVLVMVTFILMRYLDKLRKGAPV